MTNTERIQVHNNLLRECIETANNLPSAGEGGNAEVATCTIEIINETINSPPTAYLCDLWYIAYENGEYVGYGGSSWIDSSLNKLPDGFVWEAERYVLNNVVCGSMIFIEDGAGMLETPNWHINAAIDSYRFLIPSEPNVTHTLKIFGLG